ncbi:hypothetical protein BDW59DRAFT_162755 [Aspergillus cavernicola]|uniref:25S rRNA (uridine-N(3))-methyltransferase BMT5-like domain-containing protein n=1 Tax=Aspergillus cavernicola TaxID=176166 RepID=A0ABR4I8A8_9EURO
MTKPKRARVLQHAHQHKNQNQHAHPHTSQPNGAGKKHRKMSSFAKLSTKNNIPSGGAENGPLKKKKHQQKQHRRPVVPFRRGDRILLVGEGDFSFARSLATHHRCKNLLATCYDSKQTLYSKYPTAETNIDEMLSSTNSKTQAKTREIEPQHPKVLFSIDAKKLGCASGGGKEIRTGFPRRERKGPTWKKDDISKSKDKKNKGGVGGGGPWDMICFNFPHVGGLSTDVNRQVRANQELLVAFFKACVPLLAGRPEEVDEDAEEDEVNGWENGTNGSDEDWSGSGSEGDHGDDDVVKAKDERRTEPGQILVTLFEGEPYTLWNIRDLARHAGLRVVTSFRFPWACYRGYSHARTVGAIESKDGGRGGWRGEDREARMYVFEVKTDDVASSTRGSTGKRKKRSGETDDSDSD